MTIVNKTYHVITMSMAAAFHDTSSVNAIVTVCQIINFEEGYTLLGTNSARTLIPYSLCCQDMGKCDAVSNSSLF